MNKLQSLRIQIENNIELFKQNVIKFNSISDLLREYNIWDCGKSRNIIKDILSRFDISISHWKIIPINKKWEKIEKICPKCGKKFTTRKNHPKETTTCSYKCSGSYFKRHTDISKKKISESIKKHLKLLGKIKKIQTIKCLKCGTEKIIKKSTQRFCSKKCSVQYRKNDPIYLQHLRDGVQKSIKEGRHVSWKSRKIVSYPEEFFMKVLKNNNIQYNHNFKCGKYFIDFAIEINGKKIALEIDGKQHQYENRKKKDIEKNIFLTNNGWMVYRIPWKSINTENGKKYMKEQIDKFLIVLC